MSVPDYALGTTVYIQFTTRTFSTGVPGTLGGTPAISVREENNDTPITAGITLDVDIMTSPVTGLNEVAIVASSGNGYESGKEYAAYISTGTVGGVSVVGEIVGRFSIEKQSALRPTTAGRTLDVSAGGEAGVDWANVGTPGSTVGLSATTIKTATDVESDTQDIQNRLPAALVSGRMASDVEAINDDATAADNLGASALSIVTGQAQTGTLSTTQMTTDLAEATTDHYKGRVVIWTSGVLLGQAATISAYNGTGGLLTYSQVTDAPSNGDDFVIV